MRKILHIIPWEIQPVTGPVRKTLRQCRGAITAGYDVTVLSRKRKDHELPKEFDGIRVLERLPFHPIMLVREAANLIYGRKVIENSIDEVMPNIVHVHNPPETIPFVTSSVCASRGIPFIYDIHDAAWEILSSIELNPIVRGLYLAIGLFFEKNTLRRCAGIVINSQSFKDSVLKRASSYIGDKPFHAMKNIDPTLKAIAEQSGEDDGDDNYIIYAGVLYDSMLGLDDVVDVMPRLYERTGVRLIVAGDGPYRRVVEGRIRDIGAENAVQCIGHIPRERLIELMRKAKFCLMPYRRNSLCEVTVPNKLFEYMACAKPVVHPDFPSTREVLGEDDAGSYEAEDKEDMLRVMEKLLRDEALRKRVGELNRQKIIDADFQMEFSSLKELYEKVSN